MTHGACGEAGLPMTCRWELLSVALLLQNHAVKLYVTPLVLITRTACTLTLRAPMKLISRTNRS